ncbi:hypothetical protein HLI01_33660 [Rhizobium laguerreae]|uniref:hypothetical protein n=1 Tax=Rhizobium laguerreae TaxID=1076926 RepID=UPI001478763D|nr:hypothetical protein [Rhizobium laguerreae]NNH61656.1 hypothetical protein [Rhizobium laguerreae]
MKSTCLALLAAETEAEVNALIAATSEMTDSANWRPLDGRETNFNITSNQASDGGKALTELMTNMVDAVLLKHAHLQRIDPKSADAPQTMYAAVDRLIRNLRGGKLVNLDPRDPWLRDFAQKNLVIGIAGAKSKSDGLPSYTFVDNGEGQDPDRFETTFLSLSAGNKKSTPFVQGKFNMGSSGVLRYCGRKWYKLIVSRRFDGSGPWGWTLMRRRPGDGDAMPIAEYFVMPDGRIPRFELDYLYPLGLRDGRRYEGVHLSTGTAIKLYDYQVGSKFLSFKGSRDALNENLVETILPFRILDLRQTPDPKRGGDRALGVDPRPFYGMEFLLLNSHGEDGADEDGEAAGTGHIFVGRFSDPVLGEVSIGAIGLKRDLPGWLRPQNSNSRVFHTVNGQVQFKQSRGYLSQSCGFPALKDRVVVVVDASNLRFAAHNEVWKGDREHISSTLDGERYLNLVTRTIRESEALKDFQKRVAADELDRAARTEGNNLFQKLLDRDPTLAGLLSSRDPTIRAPGGGPSILANAVPCEGLYSPTFLHLDDRFAAGLDVPIDRGRALTGKTDAENGYLQRADNRGSLIVDEVIRQRFTVREHLKDGRLSVHFVPAEDVAVGDAFMIRLGLFDRGMPEAIYTAETTLRIVAAHEEVESREPATKKETKAKHAGEADDGATHSMPRFMLLTRDGREIDGNPTERWPDGYNEHDGADVIDLGGGETLYKINYDNAYHLRYRMTQRSLVGREVVTEKFILGMRILLLGYEHAVRSLRKGAERSEIGEFLDEFRRMAARGAASTVLALAENLPRIVDTSSISSEDSE